MSFAYDHGDMQIKPQKMRRLKHVWSQSVFSGTIAAKIPPTISSMTDNTIRSLV